MKVTVEINDVWMEDGALEDSFKKEVKRAVIQEVFNQIRAEVETKLTAKIKEVVEKGIQKEIDNYISNQIKTGKIKSRQNSANELTLEEYVIECFKYSGGWNSFDENIKKISAAYATQLKQRYDVLFASQIVSKLNEGGLLKEDVVKLLIEKP